VKNGNAGPSTSLRYAQDDSVFCRDDKLLGGLTEIN
jgi:hypothetical protein